MSRRPRRPALPAPEITGLLTAIEYALNAGVSPAYVSGTVTGILNVIELDRNHPCGTAWRHVAKQSAATLRQKALEASVPVTAAGGGQR